MPVRPKYGQQWSKSVSGGQRQFRAIKYWSNAGRRGQPHLSDQAGPRSGARAGGGAEDRGPDRPGLLLPLRGRVMQPICAGADQPPVLHQEDVPAVVERVPGARGRSAPLRCLHRAHPHLCVWGHVDGCAVREWEGG